MTIKIKHKRGTASAITSANPTLAAGELAFETDTRRFKIGDGTTAWASLAYVQPYVSATDRLLGRSSVGAGVVEEITCTAFGRSLIDDADAAAARTTLGVQPTASPAFTGNVLVGITSAFNANDGVQVAAAANAGIIIARTAAPSNTNSIAGINAASYDGSAYVAGGTINFRAAENWSSTNHGTDIQFRTTPTGSGGALTETLRLTGGGQLLVTAGSASACGVAFSGDPNTGLFSPLADNCSIATAGVERVRVTSVGNVNILAPAGGSPELSIASDSDKPSSVIINGGSSGANGAQLFGRRQGSNEWLICSQRSLVGSGAEGMGLYVYGANPMTLWTNNAERVRVKSDGEVLIGTTTDNGAYLLQVNSQIYATNATIATSDARFKTNVELLADATAVIEALRPVAFDFIPHEERNFATERQVGLIAQEAQAALTGTDYAESVVAQCGDHLGLAYEKLVPVLIKALQESNARIAALEERLNHA